MIELRYFIDDEGNCPFEDWFVRLDATAAAKVTTALARVEQGNLSNVKGVGGGVFEYRIDWGPGYRVYFGQQDRVSVILLTGGTKKRQQRDIDLAQALWVEFERTKPT